jgi:hypothetical protein
MSPLDPDAMKEQMSARSSKNRGVYFSANIATAMKMRTCVHRFTALIVLCTAKQTAIVETWGQPHANFWVKAHASVSRQFAKALDRKNVVQEAASGLPTASSMTAFSSSEIMAEMG